MSNKLISGFLILVFLGLGCQKPQVLAEVNGEKITKDELVQKLPKGFVSDSVAEKYIKNLLDQLITRKLFIKAGRDLGLLAELAPVLESDKKKMLISYLYDEVIAKNARLTKEEMKHAEQLASYDVKIILLEVPNESLSKHIYYDIKNTPDSASLKYPQFVTRRYPQDEFVPIYEIDKNLRPIILELKEDEISKPMKNNESYQLVILQARRKVQDSNGLRRKYAQRVLEEEKKARLANKYLTTLSSRVEYNPSGIRVLYKDVELITPEEETIWVAIKDRKKIVYVRNFLPLARRFPKLLDTLIREYAIKREIEEDLLYEDALMRGIDKRKDFLTEFKQREEDLLYEKFCLTEITRKVTITPEEINHYYCTHKQDFPNLTVKDASETIRRLLFPERRQRRFHALADSLKAVSKIKINSKALNKVINDVIKNQKLIRKNLKN
ncbi:MAG: hypothetical protein RMJ65_01830 [candidate division WOR-3 bacterium]|nr:SurA N-terminal domain-containing protein [candidate division WOR-3 bacterium]MDW7987440.1 hypothetical protein [candidate division WOR-3 bacterium]